MRTNIPKVTEVRITLYGKNEVLGFAEVVLNNALRLNDITIKKRDGGGLYLSYPLKKTEAAEYFYFNPISAEMSEALEGAIFSKLREIMMDAMPLMEVEKR
jgi:DNA-binding cell septation regulator SpoVG